MSLVGSVKTALARHLLLNPQVSAADPNWLQNALSTVHAANGCSGPVQQITVSRNANPRVQPSVVVAPAVVGQAPPLHASVAPAGDGPPASELPSDPPAAEREALPFQERGISPVQPSSAPAAEKGATPLQPSATPTAGRGAPPVPPPAAASGRSPAGQLLQPSERPMSAGQHHRERAVPNSLQPGYLWAPDHAGASIANLCVHLDRG